MIYLRIVLFLTAGALAMGAHAQIAFRASASANAATSTSITHVGAGAAANRSTCGAITPAIPGGVNGDLLVALVNVREYSATVTMAGWNQLYFDQYPALGGGAEMKVYIFWRLAAGGDPSTINQSGTCSSIGAQIARFRNVDLGQPFETDPIPAGNVDRQNTGDLDTGTQTTSIDGSMLLVAGFVNTNRTLTEGAGWTQSFDTGLNISRDLSLSLAYQLQAVAGTASVSNWDRSGGANDENYGIIFALRPAADLTINVPAATALDDVMIASVTLRPCSNTNGGACTTTATTPAGWTLVSSLDQTTGGGTGGYGHRLFVYRRVATGAEPASYSWYFGGTPGHAGAVGAILSFSGVDTTNPIIAEAGQVTGAAYLHTAPSINTSPETNAMLVSSHSANSSATWTTPAGMTERVDIASLPVTDDLGLSLEMSTQVAAAAGATGTRTAQHSNPPAFDTGATHMLALRPKVTVTHYSISPVSTTVANCDYAQVTITGHDATHAAVSPPSTRTVTLATSTGTGVWLPTLVGGTGAWAPSGLNNGTATYTWPGGESSFTVRLRQNAVVNLTVNLNDGVVTEAAAEDPTISFVNSAFRISTGANAALAIGTQIAGKPSSVAPGFQNLFLQAIRTDTSTGACVSLFPSGTDVSVEVGAQCNNPATCTQNLALASNAAASNSATFVPNGTYATSMNFRFTTANAEAPFTLNYGDAGQITLQFRRLLPAPPAATYVLGTSNAFVVRPFGFAFPGVTHGTTAASAVLAAAGDNFSMTLGAYRWAAADDADNNGIPDAGANLTDNGLTPNFAAATTLAATGNLPGVAIGTLDRASGGSVITALEWAGGTATAANWRYSEVGNGFFTATSNNYLADANADVTGNSGHDGTGAAGGYVGRFRPKHFALSAGAVTNRYALACASGFTYMNEGLRLGFTLTAQNAQNGTTQNYTGLYAKLGLTTFANWSLGARSGTTNLIPRIDTAFAPTGTWTNGVASNIVINTAIRRATPDNPDGPYAAVQFGIAPVDSDTTAMNTLDLDADNNTVNERKNLGISTEVRFGRLRLQNAVGSEKLPLPIPIEVQYWNAAAGFVTNTQDICTSLPRSAIILGGYTGALNPGAGNCRTFIQQDPITFGPGPVPPPGVGTLTLNAPTGAVDGTLLLTPNVGAVPAGSYCVNAASPPVAATAGAMSYLLGRWNDAANPDGNVNTAYDDNPSSRAAFGLFGSQPNNFIYFRENF